jgi:flavin reductase (DIM6/NTAB) family NADH-FMN oxidoreductase RutF
MLEQTVHQTSEPSILYFGTPVVLISTENEDGSTNLAPMSSIFWLGWRCMIGLGNRSKTSENLQRTGECVLNLASEQQVAAVDRLALTTGRDPVPVLKKQRGYRTVHDKFELAGLKAVASEIVQPSRVLECPVQLEAVLVDSHEMAADSQELRQLTSCFELRIQRVHIEQSILVADQPNKIDPDLWRPLIMSFQKFYGLGSELYPSRLASIPEHSYRTPDVDLARNLS